MGMYNEVFKTCPHCGGLGYLQISQIVLGFGGFYLDNPESIARQLDLEQIKRLKEEAEGQWFHCDDCKKAFKLGYSDNTEQEKIDILNSIIKKCSHD